MRKTPDPRDEPAPEDGSGALPLRFQRQALLDLADRMRNGLWLYPALWLALSLADRFLFTHALFVWSNFAVLVGITAWRLRFNAQLGRHLDRDFERTRRLFRAASLLHNLYWGALCGYLLLAPDAPALRWLMLVATVGLASGGTVILAIDPLLPRFYALTTLGPAVLSLLFAGGTTNQALAALAACFFAYSFAIAKVVGRDYSSRQRTQLQLEERARELEALSRTDALTQIPNRLHFEEKLAQAWREARRRHEPLAVAVVDLDLFKKINDTHGHPFGDRCLRAAAQALQAAVHRPQDAVSRYGGEEFVVLLPNTDLEGACTVAARMLRQVRETVLNHDGTLVPLSCSIGVAAVIPDSEAEAQQLVQQADTALYAAKQSGRGRVERYPVERPRLVAHAGGR